MKTKALLTALLMSTVILAGCTDKGADGDGDTDDPANDPTKGSISCLLVDDNFRPVQLKEEWANPPGDYQDTGFILIVETGDRVETTENGECEIAGLDPGSYTLRVAAQNHEAISKSVDVEASEESSITLEARRKASASNPVLTIEFSGFVPCATGGLVAVTFNCVGDLSGDSYRAGPILDYRTPYGTDAHYLVIEAVASQPGDYSLVFREDDITGSGGAEYGRDDNEEFDNPYFKLVLENSAVYGTVDAPEHNPRFAGAKQDENMNCGPDGQGENHDDEGDYCSWPNEDPDPEQEYNPMEALVFYWGEGDVAETPPHGQEAPGSEGIGAGAGAKTGLKLNYLISIFIGEPTPSDNSPEDDLEDYCVLCKGYLDEQ